MVNHVKPTVMKATQVHSGTNRIFVVLFSMRQARGSCASFVFGFVTFMSIGGFPSFVEDMKVSILSLIIIPLDSQLKTCT